MGKLPTLFLDMDNLKHVLYLFEDSFFLILIQASLAPMELSQLSEGCHCLHTPQPVRFSSTRTQVGNMAIGISWAKSGLNKGSVLTNMVEIMPPLKQSKKSKLILRTRWALTKTSKLTERVSHTIREEQLFEFCKVSRVTTCGGTTNTIADVDSLVIYQIGFSFRSWTYLLFASIMVLIIAHWNSLIWFGDQTYQTGQGSFFLDGAKYSRKARL